MIFNKLAKTALVALCMSAAVSTSWAADEGIETVRDMLKKRFPNAEIHSVKYSEAPGWIEVIAGSQVVYFDKEAKYMIDGSLMEVKTSRNLTEEAKADVRLKALEQIDEDEMLVYQPEEVKHTVTVITDIDCPYCRKLHSEMDDYLDSNIKVRYLLMPLKGKQDFLKTVSVWCSDDRNLAMDIAKAGGEIEQANCDHPLSKHDAVARQLGVRGTPAIVLEDGRMLPGYVPVEDLLKQLELI